LKETYKGRQNGWEDDEEDVRSYWITLEHINVLKVEKATLDRTLWRIRFGSSHGPVTRETV
jgi:hypothetical protein